MPAGKGRLYSACVPSLKLYLSETWRPVKENNVIRLERNYRNVVGWMCNVRPEDRIYNV